MLKMPMVVGFYSFKLLHSILKQAFKNSPETTSLSRLQGRETILRLHTFETVTLKYRVSRPRHVSRHYSSAYQGHRGEVILIFSSLGPGGMRHELYFI